MRVSFKVNLPDTVQCIGCQQRLGHAHLVSVRWDRPTNHFGAVFACPRCNGLTNIVVHAGPSSGEETAPGGSSITTQEVQDFERQFSTGEGQHAFLKACRNGGTGQCQK